MYLRHGCKKQECKVFIPKVICGTDTISVNVGVLHEKGRKNDSQASTRHITFHLPFGCFLDRYIIHKNHFTKVLSIPNVKAQEHDSRYK